MPELPEVETTVRGLRETVQGRVIRDVWTDWQKYFKNVSFTKFRKSVTGAKIKSIDRVGKNILINLASGKTIRIHMKMTGHLIYGKYRKTRSQKERSQLTSDGRWHNEVWMPERPGGPLWDPYNRFIHLLFVLDNNRHLVLSDVRKFARIELHNTSDIAGAKGIKDLGPEMIDTTMNEGSASVTSVKTYEDFRNRLMIRPNGKIKLVLLDQTVVAGIGNIYSDEMLWEVGVHPEESVIKISKNTMGGLFVSGQRLLAKGIDFGGDSMGDYRNIDGESGRFHSERNVYKRKGESCRRPRCRGVITRIIVGSRSAHFCNAHQALTRNV